MAEHNVNTVKTQIQSLIDLANTTTGNTDTNLTDCVNALVDGFGKGGGGGGIENGVTVCIYDENDTLIQKYEMESGFIINEPFYSSRGWVDDNESVITFPLRVTESMNIYANGKTYAKTLYDHFGISQTEYPFLLVAYNPSYKIFVYFMKRLEPYSSSNNTATLRDGYISPALPLSLYNADLTTFIENITNNIGFSDLSYSQSNMDYVGKTSTITHYINFDVEDYITNPSLVGTIINLNQ